MILKRKIYQELLDWKIERNGTSAILINGARRVGKSFIAQHFATNEYRSKLIIDFSNITKAVRDVFENDINNLDLFFQKLTNYYQVELYDRESVVIFDEVQLLPIARQMIKHLVADGRYDYIETGSLISIKQNVMDILLPSEEEELEMHPMDFE
jgi:predicted AAA+ superfamily ATPase